MFKRVLDLNLPQGQSLFLWGARKTGKSTYLKEHYPDALTIDLLKHDIYLHYAKQPSALRMELEAMKAKPEVVILDEVQKIPAMLDEIHWLIEHYPNISFILCGSSMRKLKHEGINLLGGRAWRQSFLPLCYPEFKEFNLLHILNHGLLPSHYQQANFPNRSLRAYVVDYLIPEVQWESRIRQMGAFSRFLEVIAYSNGSALNCANIARESAISAKTIQAYVELLTDMLLGYLIFPFNKSNSRQLISATPKFYFFDTGITNILMERNYNNLKGSDAGNALEQYILMELIAYRELNQATFPIQYWQTKTGLEVDFILAKGKIALEVKITSHIDKADIRGLIEFAKEHNPNLAAVICLEQNPRVLTVDTVKIQILPIQHFLKILWQGELGLFN